MARKFLNGIDLVGQLATAIGANLSTNRLLGRSSAGTGAIEEITIGSGLSLSSGTLLAGSSVRVDAATAQTIYVGHAVYGASESSAVWRIIRSTYSAAGVKLTTATATNSTWTGRASASYS